MKDEDPEEKESWLLRRYNDYLPISQQPALIIAGLSSISFIPLLLIISISHLTKFSLMAYIASHGPNLLNKLWGVQGELKESGMKTDQL